ncbi:adenylate/guanylate cyclase domain-containing protein [Arenicella xantha]|uniref:Adenylate cyclase n=1 Tax=Arenicella xantha TaxID=644221 RepID=A0A395JK77_9GAMM|nr:adenylate/guanylate cyclase domain-containing protein [Arenicella xantha]RBP51176.1 adenylate cyclase [Arenicella xantha]
MEVGNKTVNASRRFTLTLRKALMAALLTLPIVMVALLGYVAYNNALEIIDDLGKRIIHQATERVRAEVSSLLNEASAVSYANRDLIQHVEPNDDRLADDFRRQIEQFPDFSYLSFTSESGDYLHVQRTIDGELLQLRITQGIKQSFKWQSNAWISNEDGQPTKDDQRQRPYYQAAEKSAKQTWTDVYMFGTAPGQQYPGLTCATPVYDDDGDLIGVLTTDFALTALGAYLGTLNVFESGEAFILSGQQIIAHPDVRQVVEPVAKADPNASLHTSSHAPDPVIRGFGHAMQIGTESPIAEYQWQVAGVEYLGFTEPLINVQGLDWSVAIMVAKHELTESVEEATMVVVWIAIASLLTLILVGIILARAIAHPLRRLTAEVAQIGQFKIDPTPLPETWLWEVEKLSKATEEMKTGLRSFSKFVPVDLVRSVITTGVEAELGGEERVLTVSFSDIVGFTNIAERLPPAELVELLGQYMGAMTEEIIATRGTVDKYIGDAIMAFWGAPESDPDHASHACDAALRNLKRLGALQAHWRRTGQPEIDCRIGLNTGALVVGNMGSEHRLNYTVIGDAVNLAARLEALNKLYGTSILVSEFTANCVADNFLCRPIERVAVKGKSQGVLVHELITWREQASDQQQALVAVSASALAAYEAKRFAEAANAYREVLVLRPNDQAAQYFLQQCLAYVATPPSQDWTAVRSMN